MTILSSPTKLNLPLVTDIGPTYVKPNIGGPNPDIYNPNELPAGFKSVKISVPEGYIPATNLPPSVVAKAQSLLKRKSSENLPYNYAESVKIDDGLGEGKEYLALITLHFDNHPRRNLELENGGTIDHPPYWHPGVSIFEKSESGGSYLTKSDKKKSRKSDEIILPEKSPVEEALLADDVRTIKAAKNLLRFKIAKLIAEFERNRQ